MEIRLVVFTSMRILQEKLQWFPFLLKFYAKGFDFYQRELTLKFYDFTPR